MNALVSVLILFTFIGFLTYIQSFHSNEANIKINRMDETKEKNIKVNEIVKFYNNEDEIRKHGNKKYEELVKTVDNYIQRYVSLFLITSNLRDYEVRDLNEEIVIDLEISITGEDLTYLQGLSKRAKDSSYVKNLSKLDAIFSKIARLKERSFAENALKYSKSFLFSFDFFKIDNSTNIHMFLCLLITILMSWIVYHFIFHKSFYLFLGLFINGMMFWESLNEYQKRLKNVDTEIFVSSLGGIPEECDRSKLKWYQRIRNYFSEDPCLQYYKNLNKDSRQEVSILQCIIDTYSYYLIRTPFKLFGASVRDLTEEISALFPQQLRFFINFSYAPFFAIVLVFFILILFRKRLKLSFCGAAVEIGDTQRVVENERLYLTSSQTPEIRFGRKLKPWTKTRLPIQLEGRQKKFYLKSSKSEPELLSLDDQQSYEKLINTKTKHD